MPRDGSNIYHRPAGTDGIPNYPIESSKYNSNVADVEQDLNLPRPIVAGGTGATSAHDAMIALSGEIANQAVDNYDSFPFVSGSFFSNPGATSAPTAGPYYSGTAVVMGGNPDWINLYAQANDSGSGGLRYIRQKLDGVWGAWKQQASSTADLDAAYVNVAGDTMTGALVVNHNITSNLTAAGSYYFGNTGTKYLNYDGTNFNMVGGPFQLSGTARIGGEVWTGYGLATSIIRFGGTVGDKYLLYDGASTFNLNGGSLRVTGDVVATAGNFAVVHGTAPTTGWCFFGNTSTKYLNYDGTNFNMIGGSLSVGVNIVANGQYIQSVNGAYLLNAGGNVLWKYDTSDNLAYVHASSTFVYWRGSDGAQINGFQAYKPGGGVWADSSDARIKNVEGDYTRGLDDITALRPIYFTFKGNDTDTPPDHVRNAEGAALSKGAVAVPYPNSNHAASAKAATKYAGLIAQEVEGIFPEMITKRSAYIDGVAVDDLRDIDTTPLIFALINACKELKARLEALESE